MVRPYAGRTRYHTGGRTSEKAMAQTRLIDRLYDRLYDSMSDRQSARPTAPRCAVSAVSARLPTPLDIQVDRSFALRLILMYVASRGANVCSLTFGSYRRSIGPRTTLEVCRDTCAVLYRRQAVSVVTADMSLSCLLHPLFEHPLFSPSASLGSASPTAPRLRRRLYGGRPRLPLPGLTCPFDPQPRRSGS
jgi:hypothetical protein